VYHDSKYVFIVIVKTITIAQAY